MERNEMQSVIECAVAKALQDAGVHADAAHHRRLVRVLLRCAARLVIGVGAPPPVFLAMALEAFGNEVGGKASAPLLTPTTKSSELN